MNTIISISGIILALIPVLYLLFDRYIKKPHNVDIDFENAGLSRMISNHNENSNGRYIFFFYNLKIINTGNKNVTLKSIQLEYKVNGYKKRNTPISIQTGIIKKSNTSCAMLLLPDSQAKIILMDWRNVNEHFAKTLLEPNQVISTSCVFPLEISESHQFHNRIKLIVTNYENKKTRHSFKLKGDKYKYSGKTLFRNDTFEI